MLRLAVRVVREQAEVVLAELLELAPSGVEESEPEPGIVEYAVYGSPGELPALPDLTAAAGTALVEVRTEEIPDDWSERWRDFHRPLVLAGRLTVRPPWEPSGATPLDVVIDPGQAFGTGAHATTRLCLELMLDRDGPRGSLVDLGCGSGVLAIVAARLGHQPVIALDYDPAAVTATRENAARNGTQLDVRRFDLREEQVPDCEVVVANVLAAPLCAWAGRHQRFAPELILSGLLVEEADAVSAAFAGRGGVERERRTGGGWAAVRLQFPVFRAGEGYPKQSVTVAEHVRADINSALKAGEKDRVSALRLVLSELQKAAKDGREDELTVLRRERKRRQEAAAQFRGGGRPELAEQEESEAELISGYLPAELSDAELEAIIADAMAETGASQAKDMGQVMKLVMARSGGRADGKRASAQVRQALSIAGTAR